MPQLSITVIGLLKRPPYNESVGPDQDASRFSHSAFLGPVATDVRVLLSISNTIANDGNTEVSGNTISGHSPSTAMDSNQQTKAALSGQVMC